MPNNKKHHYVPKMYLKRFSNDDNHFYLYNIKNNKNVRYVPYKDMCQIDYFYGKDKQCEGFLSKKENYWNSCIEKILNNNHSEDAINGIKEFAIYQYLRTSEMYQYVYDSLVKRYQNTVEFAISKKFHGQSYDKKIVKKLIVEKVNTIVNGHFLIDTAKELYSLINDLKFLHIKYNTNKKLISSDCPILFFNPYMTNYIGLSLMGLMIAFPISLSDLIVLYDGKIYDKYNNTNYIELNKQSDVNHINEMEVMNSGEIVYSKTPFSKLLIGDIPRLKQKCIKKIKVDKIATDNEQLIAWHFNGVPFVHNLSFSKIADKYHCIEVKYRDMVTRKYEKKIDQRLENWYTIIPPIIFIGNYNYYGDNVETYKTKRKKYHQLIKEYWKI